MWLLFLASDKMPRRSINHIRTWRKRGTVKLRVFSGSSHTDGKYEDATCLKAYIKQLWVKTYPVLQYPSELNFILFYRILIFFNWFEASWSENTELLYSINEIKIKFDMLSLPLDHSLSWYRLKILQAWEMLYYLSDRESSLAKSPLGCKHDSLQSSL